MAVPSDRPVSRTGAAILLLVVAVALRIADIGNPIIHVDEQYYLLVGQRMLDGAVPYIDVWDRKPVGLFMLFAAAAALPGDDVIGYQLLAMVFAWATALVVAGGARALGASRVGAVAAGVAYLVWLPLLGGRGGQAPVFYNLPVALAARIVLTMPALAIGQRIWDIAVRGAVACVLAGCAIQLKPTAAFEAAFFGVAGLWWLHRAGARAAALIGTAFVWLLIGLAPTLSVAGWYRSLGTPAFDAWWFANVTSIALRPGYPAGELAMRLLGIAAQLSPLMLCAAIAWRRRHLRLTGERATAFGWLAAATVGFFAIGTFFDHYALPLLPPLAMVAGLALGRVPRVMIGTLVLGLLLMIAERMFMPRDVAGARTVAALVERNSRGGCPYIFIGDTATYSLSHTCLPTPRAFPNFLAYTTEAGATGIDEAAEMRRFLNARPPVIVGSTRRLKIWNPRTLAILRPTLARDYRIVFSAPRADYRTIVWLRRDLPFIR